jgi:hypothetical protein
MSEPQARLVLDKGIQRVGGKDRTLADMLLISVWVAGYAVVLGVFRITKALESLF